MFNSSLNTKERLLNCKESKLYKIYNFHRAENNRRKKSLKTFELLSITFFFKFINRYNVLVFEPYNEVSKFFYFLIVSVGLPNNSLFFGTKNAYLTNKNPSFL